MSVSPYLNIAKKPLAVVTGGCGFIGSHTVDLLIERGYDVNVIDDCSSESHFQFYFNPKAQYFHENILNMSEKTKQEAFNGARAVLHLAAKISVEWCEYNIEEAYKNNITGTVNVIQTACENNVPKFLLASTSAVYGDCFQNAMEYSTPLNPRSVYAASKVSAEATCAVFANKGKIQVLCPRYYNVYGPRSPQKGSYKPVINIFSENITKNEPLRLYNHGDNIRDFVHVADVAEANLKAIESNHDTAFEAFNIGTGNDTRISEIAMFLNQKADRPETMIELLPPRPQDTQISCANTEKAKNMLKWFPSYSLHDYLQSL